MAVLRSRDVLVRTRTQLVNHVRGAVKATGHRLRKCSTRTFSIQGVGRDSPGPSRSVLELLTSIQVVSTTDP